MATSAEALCPQSMDRDPVVCHPDLEDLLQAWPAELPDEFFEVTVDDVRRRLAQLKSERWVPCPKSSALDIFHPWWSRVGAALAVSPACPL
jgi:hypothetical protein